MLQLQVQKNYDGAQVCLFFKKTRDSDGPLEMRITGLSIIEEKGQRKRKIRRR